MSTAADAPPRSHDVLGSGAYGCVFTAPFECDGDAERSAPALPPSLAALPAAYKVQSDRTGRLWKLNIDVLRRLDPAASFLLPMDSKCVLRDRARAKDRCDVLPFEGPITQFAMRKGDVLEYFPLHNMPEPFEALRKLFEGIDTMTNAGFVHGDIRALNILAFPAENTLRLIDYDLFASATLAPDLGEQLTAHLASGKKPYTQRGVLQTLVDTQADVARLLMATNPMEQVRYIYARCVPVECS